MKIWAFCVFMPQKLQDMSSFLGFGGNSALLHIKAVLYNTVKLKHKIKSEDEQNYYFDVPYSSLNEYQQDPHFYDYECEVID